MLTTDETAALLCIQPNTLAKWRSGKGGLGPKFVSVGRAIRYRRADIRAYLEENTVSNNAEARTLRANRY
ncbi:MAG: helix-turn-helix domain-containing protein [Hyphomonadaceae bacterium]